MERVERELKENVFDLAGDDIRFIQKRARL